MNTAAQPRPMCALLVPPVTGSAGDPATPGAGPSETSRLADIYEDVDSPLRRSAFEDIVRERVLDADYPCVAAKSVLNRDHATVRVYRSLGDPASAHRMVQDLSAFARERLDAPPADDAGPHVFFSFIAGFDMPEADLGEEGFEARLWRHLQLMHEADRERCNTWDESVSRDPHSAKFSFSIAGHAFFVIGMHPNASRIARRMPVPVLVFNPHRQFEDLREAGKYTVLQRAIRERDVALQGSVNPMMAEHGHGLEARQYSGRAVPDDWQCPFSASGGHARRKDGGA